MVAHRSLKGRGTARSSFGDHTVAQRGRPLPSRPRGGTTRYQATLDHHTPTAHRGSPGGAGYIE